MESALPSPQPRVGPVRVWLLAARPATLPAAITPVFVGSAAAASTGHFRVDAFLVALVASMLIQVGTNLANDYFDFVKGADTAARLGPRRVTQSGLIAPGAVRRATVLVFGLAAVCGLYLVLVGGWPILAIGVASIAAAVLYTGGPWPLGYHGLGDVTCFIFFGLVAVIGTAFLHTGSVTPVAVVASIPVACLVTAILVVNNLRDVATDRATGKYTLAVLIGRRATRAEYVLLLAVAFAVPLARWLAGAASWWFWLPWLTAPLAISLLRVVLRQEGPPLNRALRDTARLHLFFGLLFALSLLLG
ncbi:MAG TPA: 1,4-dihydroxy-2-naphthoate polyprenyltransferase [Chloroflexota bacterium]|jgi:1,4-dihydroxy-2-naphthoate octaprenyltransferase